MVLDEARLIEKLSLIEALFAGATTPGEIHQDSSEAAVVDEPRPLPGGTQASDSALS